MRTKTLAAAVLLVVVAGLMVACGARPVTKDDPKITIGPKLQAAKITFSGWQYNGSEFTGTMESPPGGGSIKEDRVKVKCRGRNGVTLKDGFSQHPAITPGQKVKIEVMPSSNLDLDSITLEID